MHMTVDELRQLYLDYFEKNGHAIVPSSALVPENDPTTLFTGSGMQPMVPYLLGEPHPSGTRVADSQKCFRSQDIEEVGDNRHTTFFEMLGNWSFGDYFKKEQLRWFFTFLVAEVGLDPHKLYVTVFAGSEEFGIDKDDESVSIWKELFAEHDVSTEDRIFYYDETKNWWSRAGVPQNMPAGEPGGPDSEVFYDFGPELGLHEVSEWRDEACHVNCDCGRYLEIGNSVFMEYQKLADGSFSPLPQKNVDFGGGLERILAAKNEDPDVFKTSLFAPILEILENESGKQYDANEENRQSFRVIADHMRAAIMLAADGVYPSNKQQGYFARRLMRRSVRYARMIGMQSSLARLLVPVVADIYKTSYPEIAAQWQEIEQQLVAEEQKFEKALEKGMREIDKLTNIDGATAFRLYETYGFPFELTQEIAAEKGFTVAAQDFEAAKTAHAQASRTASAGTFKGGLADQSEQTTKYHTATHLIHAALRVVVGQDVEQRGSHITGERLRFDFSAPGSLSKEQLAEVTQLVNQWVAAEYPVTKQVLSKDAALKSGAIAFFVDKYPETVSVYTIGVDDEHDWISKEFCGGPHVAHTGEVGPIEIYKEKAIGAGVRRLYARNIEQ